MEDLIQPRPEGLYCPPGDFYLDPWKPVARAVITHAHSDHARPGCQHYLCATDGQAILRARIGQKGTIEGLAWGETRSIHGVQVSLHPAGHILGSAQIRLEHRGAVWVFSGDYNPQPSPATGPSFTSVRCDVFITESTFGLPIYRWPEPEAVFAELHAWWQANQSLGLTSVLPAYPLGKSQRLLAGLDDRVGPIALHGSATHYVGFYQAAGIRQAPHVNLSARNLAAIKGRGLVISSAAAQETGLIEKLGPLSWAFASGWMMTRAARRNRDFDRGFILSDHADWPGLLAAIRATGAARIGVTHGQTEAFSRWLREQGYDARPLPTRYTGETAHEGLDAADHSPADAARPARP